VFEQRLSSFDAHLLQENLGAVAGGLAEAARERARADREPGGKRLDADLLAQIQLEPLLRLGDERIVVARMVEDDVSGLRATLVVEHGVLGAGTRDVAPGDALDQIQREI